MKKYLILILVVFSTCLTYSQIKLGLNLGPDISNARYTSGLGNWTISSKTFISFGLLSEIKFSDELFFEPSLNFVNRGIDGSTPFIDLTSGTSYGNYTEQLTLQYIDLPMMVKYKFKFSQLFPYIFAGPNISYVVKAQGVQVHPQQYSQLDATVDYKNNFQPMNLSLDFGLGADFALTEKMDLFANFKYSLGLTDINKEQGFSHKTSTIFTTVGFKYEIFSPGIDESQVDPPIIPDSPKPEFKKATSARIKGKILDSKGNPIDVNVNVNDLSTGENIASVNTNANDGSFSTSVPTGKVYIVNAAKKGLVQIKDTLDLVKPVENADKELPPIVMKTAYTKIKGKILDSKGNPIDADIKIDDLTTGENVAQIKGNVSDGSFTANLQPGKVYVLSIVKDGYVTRKDTIDLREGKDEVELDFKTELIQITIEKMIVIHFDFDRYEVKQDFKPELNSFLKEVIDNKDINIFVSGHADSVGSDEYNLKLSDRRARAVEAYCLQTGIKSGNIFTKALGKRNPMVSNSTPEGRALNRRAEIKILPKPKKNTKE